MGNLCSIFHLRFKQLMQVIPCARKAQLIDYILLGWQTSNYTLKGSDQKWFMKPYAEIIEDTGIPKSTLERYIKELYEEGFIERRQALYSRTKEHGDFEVKKGTYIYITDKLLSLLKSPKPITDTLDVSAPFTHSQTNAHSDSKEIKSEFKSNCSNSDKNEGTDPLKMRGLYIRDLYSLSSNTIIFKKNTPSVDKPTLQRLHQQFEAIQQFLYAEIKEEIPEAVKKQVVGTFFNLTFTHHKQFSSPQQLVAEYLFALVNCDFYLPQVTCFKHRNNILSKMIRGNTWRTPKGFYKHFYLGQAFKDKQEIREKRWQQVKDQEMNARSNSYDEQKEEKLLQLEAQMLTKSTLIEELTQAIYQESSEERILILREQIQTLRRELERLWQQQSLIEQEIEYQLPLKHFA